MPKLDATEAKTVAASTGGGSSKPSKQAYKSCGCYVLTGPAEITVGCGQHTRSRFAMGHDAKTKSVLQFLFRTFGPDREIGIYIDSMRIGKTVKELFDELGWQHFMTEGKVNKARTAQFDAPVVDLNESELDGPAAPARQVSDEAPAVSETTETHTATPRGARRRSRSAA